MHHESFINEIKTAIQVALFKEKDMHHVAGDKGKTKYAYYFIVISALLSFLGQQMFMSWFKPTIASGLLMAAVQVVMTIVGIYVISFIATKIFSGKGKHDAFFRVTCYAMIVSWLTLIPMLGIIGGIWGLILLFVILKSVHKLSTGGAIGTMIVGIVVMGLISMVISPLYGGGYAMRGYGQFGGNTFKFDSPYGESVMEMEDEDTFEMNIPTEDGMGNIEMDDGTMKITGPNGEVMEFTIPVE